MTEPVYEITLTPAAGDGWLSEGDVSRALCGVPEGGAVEVRVADCVGYYPGAPELLARWLCGSEAKHVFADTARAVAAPWTAAFDRAKADYLAVEAARIAGGAA